MNRSRLTLGILLAAVAPVPAAAQGRVAMGVNAPTGPGAEYSYPAPALFLSTEANFADHSRLRLSLEGMMFQARSTASAGHDDLLVLGGGLAWLYGVPEAYGLVGVGYRRMAYLAEDNPNAPSGTIAIKVGVGVDLPVGNWGVFAELERSIYATDWGTDQFSLFRTLGARAGVRVPLPGRDRR